MHQCHMSHLLPVTYSGHHSWHAVSMRIMCAVVADMDQFKPEDVPG